MCFEFVRLHFHCTASGDIRFPCGRAGNMLRGAFGAALHGLDPAAYVRVFAPSGERPSGLAQRPRPFVFRLRHLEGKTICAGAPFELRLNLFDRTAVDLFERAMARMAGTGLGPGRIPLQVERSIAETMRVSLEPAAHASHRIEVAFLTPTELKPAGQPEFATLFGRARDRIGALCTFYGSGSLDLDFRGMAERASAVRMTRCEIRPVDVTRRSAASGEVHSIGGFIGTAAYEGDIADFLPFLRAAGHTGVGRHTVWGNGEIEVRELD